jgi:hypothetical protein
MRSGIEPINVAKEKEEYEREFRARLEDKLKAEAEVLFARQRLNDKEYLYSKDYHGLNIAAEHFIKMKESQHDKLLLASFSKEIELYKNIFNVEVDNNNESGNYADINKGYFVRTWYSDIKEKLLKTIDKCILIDLTSSQNNINLNNFFDIIFFSIYSNIEIIIVFAFILNHIVDASIMSVIYPITYLGYGMIEYPFTNKHYWKWMIVYSLVTITVKLIYQLPFFCG